MSSIRSVARRLSVEHPWLSVALAVLVVELVGASGAVFTVRGLSTWYGGLQQPTLSPPGWVFGPVWTGLFAPMGVAVWLVWRRPDDPPPADRASRVALATFVFHFAFNLGRSAAFFGLRSVELGPLVIAALWTLIVLPIWRSTGVTAEPRSCSSRIRAG